MTISNDISIEILNNLVLIQNDRISGYRKAIDELKNGKDKDLRALFRRMAEESEKLKVELVTLIEAMGGKVITGTTNLGKVYRTWMDIKAFFNDAERYAILDNCEEGEEAALIAYQDALETDGLTSDVFNLLKRQQTQLSRSHTHIKTLRDNQTV
ncbi:MAG: PA2169 family four-helix-bundle protein [Saprospiraceae bacterium]|nr:PA2169 family four-helix-bundle protein [Saprospiraceae bacterium]